MKIWENPVGKPYRRLANIKLPPLIVSLHLHAKYNSKTESMVINVQYDGI
jgi:hypothetical protein